MSKARSDAGDACPCGKPLSYAACCGALHAGAPAADAEALMRSRYSAYVQGREDYLLATWHASTRPASLDLGGEPAAKWLGLEVRVHNSARNPVGHAASVEFVARYRVGGRAYRLHEISRFAHEDGRWYYVDGQFGPSEA
ncbi:MAG: hypothetical protein K9J42_14880 [Sulfuritalea sp.]|nr:hypothetical protein [Sulfuritalea sp.]